MDLRESVCAGLCAYFKPEKKEETGCGGLHWLKKHPGLLSQVSGLAPLADDPLFGIHSEDPRLLTVCSLCEYRIDGCDFRDPSVPRDQCSPCGGLRAVAGLLAGGWDLGL